MLRHILCSLVLVLLAISVTDAQKIKGEKAPVAFTILPNKPMDPEFTTYSVEIYGNSGSIEDLGYSRSKMADSYFGLHSFKRVPQGGHFRISVRVSYLRVPTAKTQSYTKNVKQGETTVKKTYYKKVVKYNLPVHYTIEDYKGNVIAEASLGTDLTSMDWGAGATSSYALNKSWNDRRQGLYTQWRKNLVTSHMKSISSFIKSSYDFRPSKRKVEILVLGKKDKGTEGFMKAYQTVNTAFTKMKADTPVDVLKEEVKPAIDFWLAEKDKYSAKDKKERKVRHVCLYNIAVVFYWLDAIDEAKRYATQCLEIEWKEGRPKRVLKDSEALRKSFATNNMTTRHPSFDLENANPPSSSAFGELAPAEEEDGATGVVGSITNANGDKVEGDFVVKLEEGEDLKFGPEGNIFFSCLKDGRKEEVPLSPETVTSFTFEKRNFMVQPFVSGQKGNTEEKPAILELLYEAPTIKVFKYFPFDDKLGDKQIEYAFQKGSDPNPVSTSSTTFLLFNKGLSKYFSDCPDLAEAAGGGEFKKAEDDIIRAARVYGEMCEVKP